MAHAQAVPPIEPDVLLVADSPLENWMSMDIYAREVGTRLQCDRAVRARLVTSSRQADQSPRFRRVNLAIDRYVSLPRMIRRAARQRRPSIVHILDHSYGHLIHDVGQARAVVTCHDLIGLELPSRRIGWFLYRLAVGRLRDADRIIAISRWTKRQIVERLGVDPRKIEVAPHGIDAAFFSATWVPPVDTIRILHVGSNAPYKRSGLLVDVACRLRRDVPAVELWKVGARLHERQQIQLAQSGVRLTQFENVADEAMPKILQQASLLLFPSSHEGQGRPVAEAMAVGLPVVASGIESLRETSGNIAIHVDEAAAEAYVRAIEALVANPSHQGELSSTGRDWARRFRWEAHIDVLKQVYADLSSYPLTGRTP